MIALRTLSVTLLALAVSLAGGCATYLPTPAVPAAVQPAELAVGDLLAMLRAGRPEAEIIAEVRARGMQVPPAPADIDVLLQAGAGPELVMAVQDARVAGAGSAVTVGEPVPEAVVTQVAPAAPYWWPWFPFGMGFSFGYWSGPGWGYPARPYPPPRYPVRPYPPPVRPGGIGPHPRPPGAAAVPPPAGARPGLPPGGSGSGLAPGGARPGPPAGGVRPGPPAGGVSPGPVRTPGRSMSQPPVIPGKR